MATLLFANNAQSTLAGAITNTSLAANLAAGTGVLFPSPGAGQFFKLTFNDAATGLLREIVHVTNVSGDTITIVRAQEGTTALNWLAGDLAANLWTAGSAAALQNQPQVAGPTVRLGATLASAGTNVTFTADYVSVAVSLGGSSFTIAGLNQALNTATTGANGMDAGLAPVSGFVSIYVIFNLTSGTVALLGTTASQTTIYGGANMPAGYTMSALISIWPTDGSRNLKAGAQVDRQLYLGSPVQCLISGTATTATAVGLGTAIPVAARSASFLLQGLETSAITANSGMGLGPTSVSVFQFFVSSVVLGAASWAFGTLPIPVSRTLFYRSAQSTFQSSLSIVAYGI